VSTLRIRVDKDLQGDAPEFGAYAEVKARGIEGVSRVAVPIGEVDAFHTLDVEPGAFWVQARLPSGEILVEEGVVEADERRDVVLKSARSAHEWLSWYQFLRDAGSVSGEEGVAPYPAGSREGRMHLAQLFGGTCWINLWKVQYGAVVTGMVPPRQPQRDAYSLSIDFFDEDPFAFDALYLLQIGGPSVQPRCIVVPLPWHTMEERGSRRRGRHEPIVQVIVDSRGPGDGQGGQAPAPRLTVVVRDELVAPALAYMESGDLLAAQTARDELLGRAEGMLFYKVTNPYAAAAGGYILLRTADWQRLHEWPRNLADWFEWLPDGAVIRAWQLLRQRPSAKSRDEARAYLLKAAGRGVPVFAEGLRLLVDGLTLYRNQARQTGGADAEVESALDRMRAYAQAVDWESLFTTFIGADPIEPSFDAPVGAAPMAPPLTQPLA
jgi:hypothetical protein